MMDNVDRSSIVTIYNKYLTEVLRTCRTNCPELGRILKQAGHSVIASQSDAYINHAITSLRCNQRYQSIAKSTVVDVSKLEDAMDFELLTGVKFKDLLASPDGDFPPTLASYLYTLVALALTYDEKNDDLARQVVRILSDAQEFGNDDTEEGGDLIDGILDEDIANLLTNVASLNRAASASRDASATPYQESIFSMMKDSKLVKVADELSKEINVDNLDPSQLEINKIFDPNSQLNSIIKKVGAKIQSQISSGEMRQDELIADALNMMKVFQPNLTAGGGGGLAEMLSMLDIGKMNPVGTKHNQNRRGGKSR